MISNTPKISIAKTYFTIIQKFWDYKAIHPYLLTPWCRVLLEKLTGLQLVKKFPAFHGTRKFITTLTSVRHLSLFWASPIQSIYPHPTSWRSILILSTHPPYIYEWKAPRFAYTNGLENKESTCNKNALELFKMWFTY